MHSRQQRKACREDSNAAAIRCQSLLVAIAGASSPGELLYSRTMPWMRRQLRCRRGQSLRYRRGSEFQQLICWRMAATQWLPLLPGVVPRRAMNRLSRLSCIKPSGVCGRPHLASQANTSQRAFRRCYANGWRVRRGIPWEMDGCCGFRVTNPSRRQRAW